MALCIAAGERAQALGMCCVAVGDDCQSVGAYQVSVGEKLTFPSGYTSQMYTQFLAQVNTNMQVYDAICAQGYGPKEFAGKARNALTPLVQKIEALISELKEKEAAESAKSTEPLPSAPEPKQISEEKQ